MTRCSARSKHFSLYRMSESSLRMADTAVALVADALANEIDHAAKVEMAESLLSISAAALLVMGVDATRIERTLSRVHSMTFGD